MWTRTRERKRSQIACRSPPPLAAIEGVRATTCTPPRRHRPPPNPHAHTPERSHRRYPRLGQYTSSGPGAGWHRQALMSSLMSVREATTCEGARVRGPPFSQLVGQAIKQS